MGMAAILVMWPRCSEQTCSPPTQWGSICNLGLISPMVSEKMSEKFSPVWVHVKQVTLEWGNFGSQDYKLSNLVRGVFDNAIYQI